MGVDVTVRQQAVVAVVDDVERDIDVDLRRRRAATTATAAAAAVAAAVVAATVAVLGLREEAAVHQLVHGEGDVELDLLLHLEGRVRQTAAQVVVLDVVTKSLLGNERLTVPLELTGRFGGGGQGQTQREQGANDQNTTHDTNS